MQVRDSYASTRRAEADRFSRLLEAQGINTFLAHRDIAPGQDWPGTITGAVESADAVTVLFCRDSDQSRHVRREVALADQFGTPYFPVRLEPADVKGLVYYFSTTQWFDWDGTDSDSRIGNLVSALRRVAGNRIATDYPAAVEGEPEDVGSEQADDAMLRLLEVTEQKSRALNTAQLADLVGTLRDTAEEIGDGPNALAAVDEYFVAWLVLRNRVVELLPRQSMESASSPGQDEWH